MTPYLFPHICFDCRLSFKRVHKKIAGEVSCPNCKQPAHVISRKFQAPRRSDIEGWNVVKLLSQNGWRGHGWNVSPRMSLKQAKNYLDQKSLREHAAQVEMNQEAQNEKWRAARKLKQLFLRHNSSTR